jgi:hypothetical protein
MKIERKDRGWIRPYFGWPAAVLVIGSIGMASPAWAGSPDQDADGFTIAQGDCCDSEADGCSIPAAVNPAAMEFPGNGIDDDCDLAVDEADPGCVENFAIDDTDAGNGAASIGLCRIAQGAQDWGVVTAAYGRSNGTASNALGLSRGLLADFGPNVAPLQGGRMLGLSTGNARDVGDNGSCGSTSCTVLGTGTAPVGFPQAVAGCTVNANVSDDPALMLSLRAPSNAVGFRLRFRFYSHEWPEFVCTSFNDQMLILMDPAPLGSINGNLAFDVNSKPVGVNHEAITVCDPADINLYNGTPPDPYCPDGTADLLSTGFGTSAGAMKWQTVEAPVGPLQTFGLRLTIYDVGDTTFDSTALFDAFEWLLEPAQQLSLFRDGFEEF